MTTGDWFVCQLYISNQQYNMKEGRVRSIMHLLRDCHKARRRRMVIFPSLVSADQCPAKLRLPIGWPGPGHTLIGAASGLLVSGDHPWPAIGLPLVSVGQPLVSGGQPLVSHWSGGVSHWSLVVSH